MKKIYSLILLLVFGIAPFAARVDFRCNNESRYCFNAQVVDVCGDRDVVIRVIKELHYAIAKGDVAKLKKLTTLDFYEKKIPYSDEFVHKELLSVPYEKRQALIKYIDEYNRFSVVFSAAGDYATVWIDDTVTGKGVMFNMFHEYDCWRVCDVDNDDFSFATKFCYLLDNHSNSPKHMELVKLKREFYAKAFEWLKKAASFDDVNKIKKQVNDYNEEFFERNYLKELNDIYVERDSTYKSEYNEIVDLKNRFEDELVMTVERIIAADLIGVYFSETTRDGFFKDKKMFFAEDEKLTVNIKNVERMYDEIKYEIVINLLTSTRGRYIINGEVKYYYGNDAWGFDMFLCHSIMPQITNAYNNCVSIEHKGRNGERYIELVNHSNVKLGVYVSLKIWLNDKMYKGRIVLEPNETKKFGGLFVGDIEKYSVHYIERY